MLIGNFNVGRIHFEGLVTLPPAEKDLLGEAGKKKLVLVMPATNATSDFETYLRSTMMQDRLNHLRVTYVHKEELDKLDLRDVGNDFVKGHAHRLSIFGAF